jgi:hypothetical protein
LGAWEHIDGMMQYDRKYLNREFTTIPAIEMILKYAPLLLAFLTLDILEDLLKTYKRIERDTSDDMGDKLAKSRARMWDNHRLWGHLENHPDVMQDDLREALGGDQGYWRSVAEGWEKMGLLRRIPEGASYRLALLTRMGQVVSGKCSSCGDIAQAPKAMFLEEMTCPKCRTAVQFVILSTVVDSGAQE